MKFDNATPIYMQVIQEIKKEMIQGKLSLGEKMLSARELAIRYQINPNTANRIYRELEQEKLCFTKRGLGTFVTEDSRMILEIRSAMAAKNLSEFVLQMKALGYQKEELLESVMREYDRE